MTTKAGVHCIVTGKVQGVWFRQSTMAKARSLKLTGWVKNLRNGDVELEAYGDVEQLRLLKEWLWEGPVAAKVNQVTCNECEYQKYPSFNISN